MVAVPRRSAWLSAVVALSGVAKASKDIFHDLFTIRLHWYQVLLCLDTVHSQRLSWESSHSPLPWGELEARKEKVGCGGRWRRYKGKGILSRLLLWNDKLFLSLWPPTLWPPQGRHGIRPRPDCHPVHLVPVLIFSGLADWWIPFWYFSKAIFAFHFENPLKKMIFFSKE